jgi:hypothetical protein
MQIGKRLRRVIVEPLEVPVGEPQHQPEPIPAPEPQPRAPEPEPEREPVTP